jgi:hypothetical protein
MPLQIRRGSEAERLLMTVPLAPGELLYADGRLFVGDGQLNGGVLVTGYSDNDAKDAAAEMLADNTHSGISFSYNSSTKVISANVDLSNYTGILKADAFKGSVFADDGSTIGGDVLVDAVDGKINLDGTVKGNIIPSSNGLFDIGSNSFKFKDLYLGGTNITLGSATLTSVGSALNLPAGSTLNGTAFGWNLSTEDSTNTPITNGASLQIRGDAGIQTRIEDNALYISADITALRPTIKDESAPSYITFVGNTGSPSYIGVSPSLRYISMTGSLETVNLSCTGSAIISTDLLVTGPAVLNSVTTPFVIAEDAALTMYSTLSTTALRYSVNVGGAGENTDGRLQVITSSRYGDNNLSIVNINQSHSEPDAANFQFNRSRGSATTPTAIVQGDDIIDITFGGHDGTAFRVKSSIFPPPSTE